jgi:integrase
MKKRLSKRVIDGVREQAGAAGKTLYCYDTVVAGFGAYATATGACAYFVQYRLGGRETPSKRMTIGKHGVLTAEQARLIAKDKLGDVAKGKDIAVARQDERRKLAAGTFRDVAEKFLTANDRRNRYWRETRRLIEQNAYPFFGSQPIATITRTQIAALVDQTGARSKSAGRLLFAALRPLFTWSMERGAIEQNPIIGLRGPEPLQARERVLSDAEIKAFWIAASGLSGPFENIFKLLLLTAQRRDEVAGMLWDEIDLEQQVWSIAEERTKNGKSHTVDLSPEALVLIPNEERKRCPFVFSTTGRSAPSGFSKAKARLDKGMSAILGDAFKPWRTHDLRRTAASGMAALGHQPHVIERVLNHVSGAQGGLIGVYQRHNYRGERASALLAWGKQVTITVSDSERGRID